MIVRDEGSVSTDEYEDLLYNGLLPRIDDLLEPPEDSESVRIATNLKKLSTFLPKIEILLLKWPP